ncbi:MAG: TIGR00296 family protein [Crenarchaeota archaeon]|jgi:uncharacterized protein (TIGR00296 family)|nr:TIGR00296 family protein [Thermoproteota archaeon]
MAFELSQEEGEFLVKLSRNTVKTYLGTGKILKPPKETPQKLFQKCGVFVTINTLRGTNKELRGCIGYPYPTDPLVEAVIDSAINASTQDPRFEAMTETELGQVIFEVSVLTPPERIVTDNPKEYINKIKVGEDGLIIERGYHKGLLLPQVSVEWGWTEEEFVCQCCMKAGLPPDSWLVKDTKIFKFKAIIFEEETPVGIVNRLKIKRSAV